jgi:hypothetical protein
VTRLLALVLAYRQEHDAGEAEDEAKVLSLDESVQVPFGSYSRALMTEDTTPLEPGLVEHTYDVREIGPVVAVTVAGGGGREEVVGFSRP